VVSSFFFFFLLLFNFLSQSQPSQIRCLPYFHTWCGLSANLRCRSETCCTWPAVNTGCKKVAKNRVSLSSSNKGANSVIEEYRIILYLNIYYANAWVSCIICPRSPIVQLKQQVLLPAASVKPRVVQSTTCPVRELSSPRDDQSASWRIHELSSFDMKWAYAAYKAFTVLK